MSKIINIFSNNYEMSAMAKKEVVKDFESRGYTISESFNPDAVVNIVIGGDGTFIHAVHASNYSDIPFIGINTGHLGFYQEVDRREIHSAIDKFIKGQYGVHDLKLLHCHVKTEDSEENFYAINEVVLKSKYTSIIHFDMYVNNVLLQSFAGDGIILSTPSGSTAYNLSAGGAMLYQTLDGYQITPMAPIRSSVFRSLDKPLVVPSSTKIKLITQRREESFTALSIDGVYKKLEDIKHINVSMSDKTINKIVFNENWYWNNIKEKFL